MIAPVIWVALGMFGGCALTVLFLLPGWMANADVGVDPFAGLPHFDDTEAQRLLDLGA